MTASSTLTVAPGSVVEVRDEEWLVTAVEPTQDGQLLHERDLSELGRDTEASFCERHDEIGVLDPDNLRPHLLMDLWEGAVPLHVPGRASGEAGRADAMLRERFLLYAAATC